MRFMASGSKHWPAQIVGLIQLFFAEGDFLSISRNRRFWAVSSVNVRASICAWLWLDKDFVSKLLWGTLEINWLKNLKPDSLVRIGT